VTSTTIQQCEQGTRTGISKYTYHFIQCR